MPITVNDWMAERKREGCCAAHFTENMNIYRGYFLFRPDFQSFVFGAKISALANRAVFITFVRQAKRINLLYELSKQLNKRVQK